MSVTLLMLLIAILVVIFAVLITILRRIFTQNVMDATKHLEGLSQDFNQKQEDIKKKLEEAERTYQEKVAAAADETSKNKLQVIKEAQEEKERIIQQARRQGEEIIQQADKAAQLILAELDTRIQKESLVKAAKILQFTLPPALKKEIHTRLIGELIDTGLGQLDKMQIPADVKEIQVSCAFGLTDEQRKGLESKLKKKFNREINFKEELDEKLVAGATITVGSTVLDASLRYKIQEEARLQISTL